MANKMELNEAYSMGKVCCCVLFKGGIWEDLSFIFYFFQAFKWMQ